MEIRGKRVKIRPLKLKDVYAMRYWGFHEDPLFEDYNFPLLTDQELLYWYKAKTASFFNKYYAIYNEKDILVGYMGIKKIRRIVRKSTLGLVMDPTYMDQKYGSESLASFLNYYFEEMKMRSMDLEVAEFNKRAYRVYEKMGFRQRGYYLDEFPNQHLDLQNDYYLRAKSSFVISEQKIYNYIYYMTLKKKDFLYRKDMLKSYWS